MDIRDLLNNEPEVGDLVEMELGDVLVETIIDEVLEDGVVVRVSEEMMQHMVEYGRQLSESTQRARREIANRNVAPVITESESGDKKTIDAVIRAFPKQIKGLIEKKTLPPGYEQAIFHELLRTDAVNYSDLYGEKIMVIYRIVNDWLKDHDISELDESIMESEKSVSDLQVDLWELFKHVTGYRPRPGVVDWTDEQWEDPEFLKTEIARLNRRLDEGLSEAGSPAQQAAIAIAKKKEKGVEEARANTNTMRSGLAKRKKSPDPVRDAAKEKEDQAMWDMFQQHIAKKKKDIEEGSEPYNYKVGQHATYTPLKGDLPPFPVVITSIEDEYIEFRSENGQPIPGTNGAVEWSADPGWKVLEPTMGEGKTGPGLWANIHKKQERIKHGSGERMRKPGSEGAPRSSDFKAAAKTESVAEESNYGDLDEVSIGSAAAAAKKQKEEKRQKEWEYNMYVKPRYDTGELDEAKYHGRDVPLNSPMQGDVAKSKVYVKKPNGKIVKVNFGDKNMRIKKSNPARRKSFRARHKCDNPGPKWRAKYWSCRAW